VDDATVSELLQRVSALERKVTHLYEVANRAEPDFDSSTVSDEVMMLVQQDRTLDAIRLHREQTGLGLAEAKAAIDRLGPTG
jgi:ribosomal protein L7/L12